MTKMAGPPQIFDPQRRKMARDRAHARFAEHDFLYRYMIDGLIERMEDVQRPLEHVLLIGCPDESARRELEAKGKTVTCCDPGAHNADLNAGIQVEEDALPFADDSFDLVLACGTLDSVNDLPGALVHIRRVLKPDGLLLASMTGAGSLVRLKAALLEGEGDLARPHIHPQIEVRAAGDLLARAGFTMPVADVETLNVRYASLFQLMRDLRGMGYGNIMASDRTGPLSREAIARASAHFQSYADGDGKTAEQFAILYLSGWKPDASQPKPARRGSATVSLTQALRTQG